MVVEARDLASMDSNGKSDPYAVLHCGSVRCRTRWLPKTLDPLWNETFRFEVVTGPASSLQVDIFDRDVFTNDDFMGTLRLRVDDLISAGRDGKWADKWHELQPRTAKDTHVKGQVHLRIQARPLLDGLSAGSDDRRSRASHGSMPRESMDGTPLPPETAVVQQVSSAMSGLKSLYEAAQQTTVRVMEENNRLRAGLRELFIGPEFASCRARSLRKCVLHVREVEARGRDPRRAASLGDVRVIIEYGAQAERTDVRRGVASPRWEGLHMSFPIDSWEDDLVITLVDASQKRQGPEPIGRCRIRMVDMDSAEAGAGGGTHDAWHQAKPIVKRRASSSAHASADLLGKLGDGLASAINSVRLTAAEMPLPAEGGGRRSGRSLLRCASRVTGGTSAMARPIAPSTRRTAWWARGKRGRHLEQRRPQPPPTTTTPCSRRAPLPG